MKIGILTFHCAHNYGAVLQCYALQEFLCSIGHDVCVVDYKPQYLKESLFSWYKWVSLSPMKTLRKLSWQKKTFGDQLRKNNAFKLFIKDFLYVKNIDLASYKNDIECFVFGSDQIWRKNRNKFDPIYFGCFNGSRGKKLVSYAASMGLSSLTEEDSQMVSTWLASFNGVSVREPQLKELLSSLVPANIKVVVDPTLLLNENKWKSIAVLPRSRKRYILIYQVIFNPATYDFANEVSKRLGIEVIEISSDFILREVNHNIIYDTSPQEFLGWVLNADFVVTTSFHGTVFSLIFNRPFVSIKQNLQSDVRIESILSVCGLSERFIDCNNPKWESIFMSTPNVDFSFVAESKAFIEDILK